jgi:hypothetical protein
MRMLANEQETGQTGDWSGQRLIQGGCDCPAVCHLRTGSRTLWGVSGHPLPSRPFSFTLLLVRSFGHPEATRKLPSGSLVANR